jgi:hypothetical protein
LSDNPTRVKIAFTVDLDEVPDRISSLVREAEASLNTIAMRLERSATELVEKGNVKAAVDIVTNTRISLMGVDLRLEDCQSLLASYQATQLELTLQQQQEEEEEQSSKE